MLLHFNINIESFRNFLPWTAVQLQ